MRTRGIAAAALAVAVTIGAGAPSGALAASTEQAGGQRDTTTAASADDPVTVTLLTGDRVTVTRKAGGPPSVTIHPAEGREGVAFFQRTDGDRVLVLPSDVAPLVGETLDEALFDVAGLAAAGEDRDTVPVIVQQAAGSATLAGAAAWRDAGLAPDRRLESVPAVADDVDARHGAQLLETLHAQADGRDGRDASTPVIERVWLDAPAQALDADSAPQIGAPQAWEAGATGKGVRIAVLDTGIDATHPDLDEAVVAAQDFSGTGSVADGNGHGTHVASIAAGSGEASGGENRGIAPDADLLVGKVLDDQGVSTMSVVIEGMEWAVEQGADVVNMSLGFMNSSDGTDPASVALDALTAQHGALFVVAAGNSGEHETIGSPGTASSALTVGAVDDSDQVAGFSSKGPRADGAIKPDLAAPGDGIVAARAAGTALGEVVDAQHVAVGGTSMAAPHVAGAAAALLQMRPDLTAEQARSVLMGSADATGGTVWEEGAGRVFVPAALDQKLLAEPASVSFGEFEPPYEGALSKRITYRNTGAKKVVLDLELAVTGPGGDPAEVASLSTDQVVVPARGTASVQVTVDTAAGTLGRYSGAVVATGAGGASVRTPVGWDKQPEMFDLTVKQVGRDGQPFQGTAHLGIVDSTRHALFQQSFAVEGVDAEERTFEVPAGTYFLGSVMTRQADDQTVTQVVESYAPQITVDQDRTVTLDARDAVPVTFDLPLPAERTALVLDGAHVDEQGRPFTTGIAVEADADTFVTPTGPVTVGSFDHVTRARLTEPAAGDAPPSYTYDLAYRQAPIASGTFVATTADLATVTTTYADPVREATASSSWSARPDGRDYGTALSSPVAPGTRTEYLNAADVRWSRSTVYATGEGAPVGQLDSGELTLEPGSATATSVGGAPHSPGGFYGIAGDQLDITTGWSDSAGDLGSDWGVDDMHLVVRENGQVVADENGGWAAVTVPPSGADYEVTFDGARGSDRWHTGAAVAGEWSFRTQPGSAGYTRHDLLDVRYDVAGIGPQGRAPGTTEVTVHAVGGDGAAVTGLSWSADGGTTWTEAELVDGVAVVDAPEGASAISLRTTASDTAGATTTETVTDAYLVR